MEFEKNINYHQEFLRKMVHLSSLSIPIVYYFLDKWTTFWLLLPLTLLFVGADLLMKVSRTVKKFVISIFGRMMRPHELKNELVLNGASWVMISSCLCILILPKISFICGFTILIIADTSAALLGRKYGKHPWFKNKTVEGSAAFFGSALLCSIIIGALISADLQFYIVLAFASLFAAFIEAVSGAIKIDDNISIPLSVGLIIYLFDLFLSNVWSYNVSSLL